MASTRIAMVAEPLHKGFYENERSISAMQVMQLEHEAPPATAPRSVRLVAQCPIPKVLSCDTTVAHLEWDQPSYVSPPADVALPRLEAHSFQIEWAEVSFRTPNGIPQIADDAWKPLPSGDVTAAEVKVGGLRPGRSYALRINVTLDMSHVDTSAWEITPRCSPPQVFVTKPSAPSAVKPPLLLSRERKALKVKWPLPDEPGGENMPLTYQLFMSPAPQGFTSPCDPQGFVEVYQGPDRNAKVGKLIPGARYNFWVLARNSEGFSPPGQVATYTTQATVPAQPEAPRPVSCTQSSITLQWVAPPGNGAAVSNYILERDEGGTLAAQRAGQISNNFTLAYAGPLQTVMVGGLRSGLHYRFRLRAENDEGASFWSESCLATPAASAPGIPSAVVMSSITQQSATVAWGGPADDGGSPVLAHEVEIQAVSNAAAESMGSGWLKIFEGCITACTISSLQPGCTYRVRVRCANQAGWGGWCMPVDLVTAPDVPGAPGAAVIQQSGTTDLTLTWQPPRHNGGQRISAFLVELLPPSPSTYSGPVLPRVLPARTAGAPGAPMPVSNPASILVYRGDEPVAQVSGLQPGLMYQFRVQACNALGAGPWGEWSTLGTAPDMPSSMMPPCLAAPPSSTALRIAWQSPDARGAPVCAYVLQAAVQGQMTSAGQLIPHSHSAADLAKLHNGDNGLPEAAAQAAIAPQHAGLAAGPWQQVYRGPAMQAEMNSLQPCTRYLLRVAAANAVGLGGWSPVTALTTAPAPPSAPTVAVASAAGTTAISVMWQPPTTDNGSAVTGYTVDMMPAGGSATGRSGWQQVASVGSSECCALVSGLLPGRAYLFRVRAANACGLSPYCAAPTIATEPAPPSAPLRLALVQRLATQAKVRWDEPTDCNGALVEEYRLELACLQPRQPAQPRPLPAAAEQQQQQNGLNSEPQAIPNGTAAAEGQQQEQQPELVDAPQQQGPVWEEIYCGMETSVRVPDLQPGCRYLLRVCAVNAAGRGPYSPEEPFTTALAPPGPPEGLEACLAHAIAGNGSEEGTHAVQLRWLPPAPCASQALVASYELHAVPVAPGHGHELKKVVGKATSFAWEELQPGLRYALRVRAAGMEGAGHGAWSEAVEMVMPGNSRGVTDSADSMSAASGTGEGAPLLSLSAMSLGKGALLGGERGASRKRAGKKGGRQAARQSSYNEANDDALSVTSQAQSVRAGLTGSATNGCGSGGAGATTGVAARGNRVNTSKLTPVAVQKRPKTGLQLGRELKQLVTAPGQVARRAQRAVSKTVYRFGSKYMWHILAILLCAALAFAANYTYNRITKGPTVVLPSGGFRVMGRY